MNNLLSCLVVFFFFSCGNGVPTDFEILARVYHGRSGFNRHMNYAIYVFSDSNNKWRILAIDGHPQGEQTKFNGYIPAGRMARLYEMVCNSVINDQERGFDATVCELYAKFDGKSQINRCFSLNESLDSCFKNVSNGKFVKCSIIDFRPWIDKPVRISEEIQKEMYNLAKEYAISRIGPEAPKSDSGKIDLIKPITFGDSGFAIYSIDSLQWRTSSIQDTSGSRFFSFRLGIDSIIRFNNNELLLRYADSTWLIAKNIDIRGIPSLSQNNRYMVFKAKIDSQTLFPYHIDLNSRQMLRLFSTNRDVRMEPANNGSVFLQMNGEIYWWTKMVVK